MQLHLQSTDPSIYVQYGKMSITLANITTLSAEKRVRNYSEFTRKRAAKKTGPQQIYNRILELNLLIFVIYFHK